MNGQEILWIIVATIVATVLKWAEARWPTPEPRRRTRRRRTTTESEGEVEK